MRTFLTILTTISVLNHLIKSGESVFGIPNFIHFGYCAEVELMKNFEPNKYEGLWFDIQRVPNEFQEGSRCIHQNYTWDESEMTVESEAMTSDGKPTFQRAKMTPNNDTDISDDEWLSFMYVDAVGVPRAPYKILWTDYLTTSCVYSCLQYYGTFKAEFAWIIGRYIKPALENIQVCLDLFTSYNMDINKLVNVEQGDNCMYNNTLEAPWNETQAFGQELEEKLPTVTTQMSHKTDTLEFSIESVSERLTDNYASSDALKSLSNHNQKLIHMMLAIRIIFNVFSFVN